LIPATAGGINRQCFKKTGASKNMDEKKPAPKDRSFALKPELLLGFGSRSSGRSGSSVGGLGGFSRGSGRSSSRSGSSSRSRSSGRGRSGSSGFFFLATGGNGEGEQSSDEERALHLFPLSIRNMNVEKSNWLNDITAGQSKIIAVSRKKLKVHAALQRDNLAKRS